MIEAYSAFRTWRIMRRYKRWANDEEFWQAAAQSAQLRYRVFRRTLTIGQVDAEIPEYPPWVELKQAIKPTDLIWPFEFNQYTSAYRKGIVVIRGAVPHGGVVWIVS